MMELQQNIVKKNNNLPPIKKPNIQIYQPESARSFITNKMKNTIIKKMRAALPEEEKKVMTERRKKNVRPL